MKTGGPRAARHVVHKDVIKSLQTVPGLRSRLSDAHQEKRSSGFEISIFARGRVRAETLPRDAGQWRPEQLPAAPRSWVSDRDPAAYSSHSLFSLMTVSWDGTHQKSEASASCNKVIFIIF